MGVYFLAIGAGLIGHKVAERKLWEQKRWIIRQLKRRIFKNDSSETLKHFIEVEEQSAEGEPGAFSNLVTFPQLGPRPIRLNNGLNSLFLDTSRGT